MKSKEIEKDTPSMSIFKKLDINVSGKRFKTRKIIRDKGENQIIFFEVPILQEDITIFHVSAPKKECQNT